MKYSSTSRLLVSLVMLASLLIVTGFAPPDGDKKRVSRSPVPEREVQRVLPNYETKASAKDQISDAKIESTRDYQLNEDIAISSYTDSGVTAKGTVSVNDRIKLKDGFKMVTPSWMSRQSDGSPLNWPEIVCISNESEVIQAWEDSGRGQFPPSSEVDPMCLDMGEPTFDLYDLTGDVILDPVDTGRTVSIVFRPQGIPAPFSASVVGGQLPGNLRFDSDGSLIAIYTPLLTNLTSPLHTETFTLRIFSNGTMYDFDVTLPINLKIHGAYSHTFHINSSVNTQFSYSGGPQSCTSVPAVPCGPVSWSYAPSEGGPLPLGLSLNQSIGNLGGTVSYNARSSKGKLHLSQDGEFAERAVEFLVPVYLVQSDIDNVAGVHEIVRDRQFDLRLPRPLGGDGSSYTWSIEYQSPRLPLGLSRVQNGDSWHISGTVAPDAAIESRTVRLRVSSTMGQPIVDIPMEFRLTVPFDVWTQNTILRPPTIIDTGEIVALSFIPFIGPGAASLATAIKVSYDNSVQNTEFDNRQRTNMILDRAAGFDIVALQEVFEEDNQEQVIDQMSQDFSVLWGPPATSDIPTLDIPINSGLATLINKDLTSNSSNAPAGFHQWRAYNETGGLTTTDGWARKGFTLDKVHFGPNTDDYVWVANTHTKAGSGDNAAIRQSQLTQMGNFITANADANHPVLLMGDFNVVEESLEWGAMLQFLGLPISGSDLFMNAHPVGSSVARHTIDTDRNAYALNWDSPGAGHLERLDYILVRQGTDYQIEVSSIEITDDSISTSLCSSEGWLSPPVPASLGCYISDHFGIRADLKLVTPQHKQ